MRSHPDLNPQWLFEATGDQLHRQDQLSPKCGTNWTILFEHLRGRRNMGVFQAVFKSLVFNHPLHLSIGLPQWPSIPSRGALASDQSNRIKPHHTYLSCRGAAGHGVRGASCLGMYDVYRIPSKKGWYGYSCFQVVYSRCFWAITILIDTKYLYSWDI